MASPIQRLRALHPSIDIGFKALTRNRLQTGLTMLGITVGVATVLAMMAVGAGAQRSIEQQVRAAGLNQLTIKAGNWKPKTEDSGGAVAHQGDAEDTMRLPVEELMPVLPDAGDPFAGAADVLGEPGTGWQVAQTVFAHQQTSLAGRIRRGLIDVPSGTKAGNLDRTTGDVLTYTKGRPAPDHERRRR